MPRERSVGTEGTGIFDRVERRDMNIIEQLDKEEIARLGRRIESELGGVRVAEGEQEEASCAGSCA